MTAETQETLSYQRMLRAVGSKLDDVQPRRFRIVEVPGGFTLVFERWDPEPALQEEHFSQATLLEKAEQLMRGRKPVQRGIPPRWSLTQASYEDSLRALGFELDDCLAHGIFINEVEDGLIVTYSYVEPSQGYAWRKHMVKLGSVDVEQVLTAARERRQRRKLLGFMR